MTDRRSYEVLVLGPDQEFRLVASIEDVFLDIDNGTLIFKRDGIILLAVSLGAWHVVTETDREPRP